MLNERVKWREKLNTFLTTQSSLKILSYEYEYIKKIDIKITTLNCVNCFHLNFLMWLRNKEERETLKNRENV